MTNREILGEVRQTGAVAVAILMNGPGTVHAPPASEALKDFTKK